MANTTPTANRAPARLAQEDGRQSQPHTPKAPTVEKLTYEYVHPESVMVLLLLVTMRMWCPIPAGSGAGLLGGPTDQAKAPIQGASRGVREVIRCR